MDEATYWQLSYNRVVRSVRNLLIQLTTRPSLLAPPSSNHDRNSRIQLEFGPRRNQSRNLRRRNLSPQNSSCDGNSSNVIDGERNIHAASVYFSINCGNNTNAVVFANENDHARNWETVHQLTALFNNLVSDFYEEAGLWMQQEVMLASCTRLRVARHAVQLLSLRCHQPMEDMLAALLRAFITDRQKQHEPLMVVAMGAIFMLEQGGTEQLTRLMRDLSSEISVRLNVSQMLETFASSLDWVIIDSWQRVDNTCCSTLERCRVHT